MSRDVTKQFKYNVGKSVVRIGRFSYGFEHIDIMQWNEGASLEIGSFCSIAKETRIFLGGNHRLDWTTTYPFGHVFNNDLIAHGIEGHPTTNGDVTIGHDVWIGSGTTIMSGVKVGHGAVIAANSHITKDVDDYAVVGGNPGRFLRYRFPLSMINRLLLLRWWELPIDKIESIAPDLSRQPSVEVIDGLIRRFRS